MERLLFLLLIIPIIYSCSSEDEKYDVNDAIVIDRSELQSPTAADLNAGYFQNIYDDGDKDICISYYWVNPKTGEPTYASIGTCPKCNYEKQIYVFSEDMKENGFVNPFYLCKSCKSRFNINTGRAMNEEAKGYSMPIFKAKANFVDYYRLIDIYVWK